MKLPANPLLAAVWETSSNIGAFLSHLVVAAALFGIFAAIAAVVRNLLRRSLEPFESLHWTVRQLLVRAVYVLLLVLGLIFALSAVNINVTGLVTSLGVAGFALGFALKDIIENLVSGTLLLASRPFEIGDQVIIGKDFEGVVAAIELRTTTLHTFTNDLVAIPNTSVYTNAIINHSKMGVRRYAVEFTTPLSSQTQEVERRSLELAAEVEGVHAQPNPALTLVKLESTANLATWHLSYWADPTKAAETSTGSQLLTKLKAQFYETPAAPREAAQ